MKGDQPCMVPSKEPTDHLPPDPPPVSPSSGETHLAGLGA